MDDSKRFDAPRRLLPLLRPFRWHIAFAVGISLGAMAAQVAEPMVIKRFVDDAVRGRRPGLVVPYALASLALGFVQSLCWLLRRNSLGQTALGVEYSLRNRLYAHLQRLEVSFHDGWQSGQLVSRAISDISAVRRFLGFGLPWLGLYGFLFAFVIAMLVHLDAMLAFVTIAATAPVAFVSHRFAKLYRAISLRSQDQQADLTTIIEESATGVRVIKAFGRMSERSAAFARRATVLRDTNLLGFAARATFWSFDNLLLSSSVVVILLLGSLRVAHGRLTLGGLVAFISYQAMVVWPIRDVGWIVANAQEAFAGAQRVFEILDTPPAVDDTPGAGALQSVRGHVRLEHVRFVYPGTRAEVLRGLDLEITPGETLALVGMTGCGKTTVAALISRFYDPTAGRVLLDGRNLREVTVASVRSHIGVAFEEPILFSASVRENLLMGRPHATDDDIWDALETASAAGFVRELPWGLDTRVGEQGYSLSGGQRQRLALARAVVASPAVLVLDDPLSSVDVHTEADIEDALRRVLAGRTALLVAHRPSTVLLADRVALLHDGRIIATGKHHDLLETVPAYRDVLAAQAATEHEEATA
jgi:ATP-binding cassette subfamily B protein